MAGAAPLRPSTSRHNPEAPTNAFGSRNRRCGRGACTVLLFTTCVNTSNKCCPDFPPAGCGTSCGEGYTAVIHAAKRGSAVTCQGVQRGGRRYLRQIGSTRSGSNQFRPRTAGPITA
jgi:hypothetical protein